MTARATNDGSGEVNAADLVPAGRSPDSAGQDRFAKIVTGSFPNARPDRFPQPNGVIADSHRSRLAEAAAGFTAVVGRPASTVELVSAMNSSRRSRRVHPSGSGR